MVLKESHEKTLKDLKKRINDLDQSKKEADEKNLSLLSFLCNEIGSKDLDNLRELLAGKKLIELLSELDDHEHRSYIGLDISDVLIA
ncbi:1608_t:CDS:2, partial [Funneliformis geosporum]